MELSPAKVPRSGTSDADAPMRRCSVQAVDEALLSCGRCVRVARPDRARRAMISFVDEAHHDIQIRGDTSDTCR